MTTQKTFKRRVRDRMAKTGESYTAARRQLIADVQNRTETAMPQARCYKAMELALTAQRMAERGTVWAQ